jgi:hypothetical protein
MENIDLVRGIRDGILVGVLEFVHQEVLSEHRRDDFGL